MIKDINRSAAFCSKRCRSHVAGDVAGQPLLADLEELLGPAIVEVLGDAFLAAEFGDAVLAAQAIEDDADLLDREVSPSGSPDVPDRLLRALRSLLVSLSHRVPPRGDDEPETISYAISSICPVGPDGEHRGASADRGASYVAARVRAGGDRCGSALVDARSGDTDRARHDRD